MKLTFRWYGDDDPVTLSHIRQIPQMSGIVSAIYDVPVGEVWSRESIAALKKKANDNGLAFEVVESVPVHEDIKLGNENAPRLIENYCENVRRLGEAGVKYICYNFMPVFDWLRRAANSRSLLFTECTVSSTAHLTQMQQVTSSVTGSIIRVMISTWHLFLPMQVTSTMSLSTRQHLRSISTSMLLPAVM